MKSFLDTNEDDIIDGDQEILFSIISRIQNKKNNLSDYENKKTKIQTNLIGIGSPDIEYM